jgi:hypothetical protein
MAASKGQTTQLIEGVVVKRTRTLSFFSAFFPFFTALSPSLFTFLAVVLEQKKHNFALDHSFSILSLY